ncbi:MAG TPA: site-2 protease family protein [Candidatus Acidoferrales bacterium]|nr:site-2 protease family protein [Candidatus Acidoferrales bacterium]
MATNDSTRGSGLRLFRIGGIQITLDYSWFMVFALVLWSLSAGYFPNAYPGQPTQTYWTVGLLATFLFFFSIITHELSHSLMAIRSGIKIPEITLFIFGGMARLSEEANDPKTEFKIAVVGPLTSFALALVFWLLASALRGEQPSIVVQMFSYLAWINFALGVFNLVPGFPLDGGRILRALWWWKTGSLVSSTRVASDWGKGLAVALMVLGGVQIFAGALVGGVWLILIGMFLRGLAESSYQEIALRKSLEGTRVEDVMICDVVTVSPDLSVKRAISDYFLRYGYHGFPVTSDGRVLGVVSLASIKDIPESEQATKTLAEVMTPLKDELTIAPHAQLSEALARMSQLELGRLLVMRGDDMVGMITKTGLLRFLEIKRVLGQPEAGDA